MEPAVDLIGTVPLFERLDASLRARIEAITDVVSAEAGQVLLQQGAMPEFLYILLEGQVALSSTAADGTTALVEVLHPIDHFVLASVMTRLPYLMTARTVTECRLLAIHAGGLLDLVEHEAPLANTLLRSVSREFRTMVRQVRDLKLRTAAQRLGCYLLARVKDGEATNGRLPPAVRQGPAGGATGLSAGEPVARLCHAARVWCGDARVTRHSARHRAAEGAGGAGRSQR